MRALSLLLSLALLLAVLSLPGAAEPKDVHPLAVLKASFTNDGLNSARAVRGECTIILKNLSDVTVDGVKVTLKLAEGSRILKTLDKEVGAMEAGRKAYVDYRWEEYSDAQLRPQIWVTYNGANGPVTFRTEPPVW